MMSYNQASQYIEDNTTNKAEKCEDKYYCGKCKKTTNWTEYSGSNGIENWSTYECDKCGAGDNYIDCDYDEWKASQKEVA